MFGGFSCMPTLAELCAATGVVVSESHGETPGWVSGCSIQRERERRSGSAAAGVKASG